MIEKVNEEIEKIKSNIDILPTNNKKNIEKYTEYVTKCFEECQAKLKECENEIIRRKDNISSMYESTLLKLDEINLDYDTLKLSDVRCSSNEKMNLNYLLYKLNNSSAEGLSTINEVIQEIFDSFKTVGIILTEKDFNHTESVNLYISTLLNSKEEIQNIFNEIYFKEPNIIKQISLNVWYLYYKNKSKIDAYYKEKYAKFDFHNYIALYRAKLDDIENIKHTNKKYIYDLFINSVLDIDEYADENKMNILVNSLVANIENVRNYGNLVNYKKSLIEYKGYSKYQFIITDFKELFSHKEEYKDLFNNKLKEISKEEKNLFSINKKINKKGLFKLNREKLANAKLDREKIIANLLNLYKELDELAIKDVIKNYFTNETNYYDVLKLTTYNFNYFISLLEKQEVEINIKSIDDNIHELQKYIYDRNVDVIDNIGLLEEKDVLEMITQKYKLNGIIVDEEKISGDQVDKVIESIDKLLIYYDIINLGINLKDIKFVIDSSKELTKNG
ncbi:MAG: hypothetical protein IJK67_00900 [Bacilli bacterium]|nr:hypothetical protein [Bacilli bacterium]